MLVGVCKVTLRLPENGSLKGKRRAISSLCSRVRSRFNVAIAEVGDQEAWQVATLGITCVSNSARLVNETLSQVVSFIEGGREEVELVAWEQETITGF